MAPSWLWVSKLPGVACSVRSYHLRAAELRPDSWVPPYNAACLHAVEGRHDEALAALARAVELGVDRAGHLDRDPDLGSLRALPAFVALRRAAR